MLICILSLTMAYSRGRGGKGAGKFVFFHIPRLNIMRTSPEICSENVTGGQNNTRGADGIATAHDTLTPVSISADYKSYRIVQ